MNGLTLAAILGVAFIASMTLGEVLKHRRLMAGVFEPDEQLHGGQLMPLDNLPLDGTWEIMCESEMEGLHTWQRYTPKNHLAVEGQDSGVYVVAREVG